MRKKAPDPIDVQVGRRVRLARTMIGLSQEKIAEHLGVTFQQVQKYERGDNRIAPSRLQKVATVTGKPVSWFFDEGDGGSPAQSDKSIVERMLIAPGGVKLAEAYVAITNNSHRHIVVTLAESLADVKSRPAQAAA